MKLYNLPQKEDTKIYCAVNDGSTYIVFDHMDGLYGFAVSEKGSVVHPHANAEVEPFEDGYVFINNPQQQ